jgi:hypothetical protein
LIAMHSATMRNADLVHPLGGGVMLSCMVLRPIAATNPVKRHHRPSA